MSQLVRRLVITAALTAVIAPSALAGGANCAPAPALHVRCPFSLPSGPMKDGTYTVRTYACSNPAALQVTAWAEGLVDGKRQTVPLRLQKTKEKGVYQFARAWSGNGTWAIRMKLGNQGPHAPVTVTALEANGNVRTNELIWEGDGTKECVAILSGDGGC